MSWRNASSSRRRPRPSRSSAERRGRRFAGDSVKEVRELIAKCQQVVVLRSELAQFLQFRQGTPKESASSIQPSAQGMEAGEIVASERRGTGRPAPLVDERVERFGQSD